MGKLSLSGLRWRENILAALLLFPSIMLYPAGPGNAQSIDALAKEFEQLNPREQKLADEISDDLRCPTCTGLSIGQSDAPFSLQIRRAIIEQVRQGHPRRQIMKFFTERYGLWILREPPAEGFHFLAWLFPVLLLILGPLLLWFFIWKKKIISAAHGIRETAAILTEMNERLSVMRASNPTKKGARK